MKCPDPSFFFAAFMRRHAAWAAVIASLCVVPQLAAQPSTPSNLQADSPMLNSLRLIWNDTSADETGFELQRSTDRVTFTLRATLAANSTSFLDDTLSSDTSYWYRIRTVRSGTYSDFSNVATGRTLIERPLPSAWTGWDVGHIGPAGSESSWPPALTMHAGGTDIFGTDDAFRYMMETQVGDMTVIARVDSMTNTHPWAKAGVMIRASLKSDSANVAMLLTAGNACVFQYRATGAMDTASTSGGYFNASYWVKLTRVGNLFTGYISPDGVNWRLISTEVVAMPAQVYVGMAGCSHSADAQTIISFSNANVLVAPPAPTAIGVMPTAGRGVHITWIDNSTYEDGFRIYVEELLRDSSPVLVGTTAANVTSFDVTGLRPETSYNIYVAAVWRGEEWERARVSFRTPQPADEPPYMPADVRLQPSAPNTLTLTWRDVSTTETSYEVQRATSTPPYASTTPFILVATLGANATSYTESGLTGGTVYAYQIRAVNGAGHSDYTPIAATQAAAAPNAPTGLAIDGATDTTLRLTWTDMSSDETGFELQRATGTGGFTAIFNLAANATSYTDTGLAPGQSYSYRVRSTNGSFNSEFSAVATGATSGGSTTPPVGWTGHDIGNTGSTGSDNGSPPTVTMNAGGADIFGTADSFHGLFSSAEGDMTVVARVASMTTTHAWAKAGVMIRASLSPDAPNAAMLLTASNVCVFQARTSAGADTSSTSGGWFNAPYWVKLTRVGNTFSGYISPDGVTWQLVGTQDIVMPAQVIVAIAGSSHTTAAQTVISFSNIAVTGGSTALAAPTNLQTTNVTAHGVHLTWTDNGTNEAGFRVYAEDDTPHRGFQLVGTTAANVTSVDIGLQSNDHYYVIVAAFQGATESWSDAITVSTPPSPDAPPAAPPHIYAYPDAPNSLRVSWDDVSTTETGFEIERATAGDPFALVGTSGANVAYYSDAGLTAGTTYSYRVRAMNGTHASGYSPVGTGTAVAAPTAPTGLAMDARTDTTLRLTWTDTSNNETGFELRRTSGGASDVSIRLAANTTSYTDTGLVAGTAYSYRVHAYNDFTSGDSNVATGSTTGGTPPPPPPSDALTGSDIGTTGSTGSESGAPPTVTMIAGGTDIFGTADGFRGMFKVATGDMSIIAKVDSMTNTHPWAKAGVMIRTSLSPDSPNIAMLLTAGNACAFQSRDTAGGTTTSTSGGYFNAPYWVKLTATGGNSVTGYISPDGVSWTLVGSRSIAMFSGVYIGLVGCSHNPSAQTTISFSHVAVDATRMPYAPSNFQAVATGPHTIRLTWHDNSDNETAFKIRMDTQTIHSPNPFLYTTVAANVTTCDVIGLQANHEYVFFVSAASDTQESGWMSNSVYASTPEDTAQPPLAPAHIAIYRSGAGSLHVYWDDVSTTESGFVVERATGGGAFAVVGTTGANVADYTDSGLTDGTTYSYRIRAVNGAGYSDYSPVGSEAVSAVPEAPTNLAIDARTDSTLHLTWADRSNNEAGFKLLRSTASAPAVTLQLAANTTSYTDTGLASGTTYSYRVQAYNDLNSGYSNMASESTYGIAPPPPSSTWTSRDIGNVGSAGSDSGLPPTVTMNASGSDIYDSVDGFHSLFKTETGDMTMVARVAAMTNTHAWAKAGVMIRASLDANAPNAAMLLTAGNVCTFQSRVVSGGSTQSQNGGWFNAPYWVKLTRVGNTFTGYVSPDGLTWTLVGSRAFEMAAQVYVGLAGCSHNPGVQTVITFDGVVETGTSPPPPPAAWTRVAWNAGSSSGLVHEGGDAIIIRGMSGDIWDRSDSGTFMYKPVTGDDLLAVRIDTITFASDYSKAGLMFRATLDANSPNVCVVATPGNGILFQVRQSAGDVTTVVREVPGQPVPVRLWLGRTDNQFLAAYSTDEGATWIPLGEVTVPMPADIYLGPVAASHNTTFESSAAFSNITPR